MFQILSILTGRAASISEQQVKGGYVPGPRLQVMCCVGHGRPLSPHKGGGLERRHYRGIVWCPETATGTWVMRHNGHVIVTGNSCPGMARRLMAYNFDRAMTMSTIVLVEGPTDVWSFGPAAMGLIGKSMSFDLLLRFRRMWSALPRPVPVVILLDPDMDPRDAAKGRLHHSDRLVAKLRPYFRDYLLDVRLDSGTDPGKLSRDYLHDRVLRAGRQRGLRLSFEPLGDTHRWSRDDFRKTADELQT